MAAHSFASMVAGLHLEEGTAVPLYRQLTDQIAARIGDGVWPAGYRLPSTRRLAKALSVHRNTVVRAFEELVSLGYITSTVGRGTFVAPQEMTPVLERSLDEGRRRLPWESLVSSLASAEVLGRSRRFGSRMRQREVYQLSRMEPAPSLFPVQRLQHCIDYVLRTQGPKSLGYRPQDGVLALREGIVADLARKGIPARVEDVMITTGSQQALDLLVRGLVEPGDAVLLQARTYAGALGILASLGGRGIGVPGDHEGPSMAFLDRFRGQRIKAFYLMPDVCNPTGLCISQERREALLAWSHKHGVPLIEDDYAAGLDIDDVPRPAALRSMDGEVIYIGTFSKRLIPALRIGYLICPEALRERLLPIKYAMDLGTSVLLQEALAEFIDRGYLRAHQKQMREGLRERRDALQEALSRHLPEEVEWQPVTRGPLIWLTLPPEVSPEIVMEEARRQGVMVTSDLLYETGPQSGPGGLRLVFTYESPERLAEAGKRLGQVLQGFVLQRKHDRNVVPIEFHGA